MTGIGWDEWRGRVLYRVIGKSGDRVIRKSEKSCRGLTRMVAESRTGAKPNTSLPKTSLANTILIDTFGPLSAPGSAPVASISVRPK
jgi:hypothetical protein